MRTITHIITRYRLPLLFGVLVIAFLMFAAVFATVEERTIHIFPTESTELGWNGAANLLQQELSGSAIYEDFNEKNSASVSDSSWYTNESRSEDEKKLIRKDKKTTLLKIK